MTERNEGFNEQPEVTGPNGESIPELVAELDAGIVSPEELSPDVLEAAEEEKFEEVLTEMLGTDENADANEDEDEDEDEDDLEGSDEDSGGDN